jgi:molecular chaperone GrpE
LLPVLDALDLAADPRRRCSRRPTSSALEAQALIQVRSLLVDTLTKEGLSRVDEVGVAFDPNVHDAVAFVEGEGEQVIDEILRAGYLWKGSVVRPAMVRVRG